MRNSDLQKTKMTEDKCCFCGTIKGALVRLHQGWCCIPCFEDLLKAKCIHCGNRDFLYERPEGYVCEKCLDDEAKIKLGIA